MEKFWQRSHFLLQVEKPRSVVDKEGVWTFILEGAIHSLRFFVLLNAGMMECLGNSSLMARELEIKCMCFLRILEMSGRRGL